MAEPVYGCCEHCEATTPHDPMWKALGLPHTTPCRLPHTAMTQPAPNAIGQSAQ